jgi:hypothetical protein
MALVLNVEFEVEELGDGAGDGRVVGARKNSTVVDIDNKNNIAAIKYTIVHQGWCETNLPQLFDLKIVPNLACLLLTVDVREQFQKVFLLELAPLTITMPCRSSMNISISIL